MALPRCKSIPAPRFSAKNPRLNAALTGVPRTIAIANTGRYDAKGVTTIFSSALPVDASCSSDYGSVLPAGSSCTITITPGPMPPSAPLVQTSTPPALLFVGENTNALTATIHILSHGSVYQAGYVFTLDDSMTRTASVGGKVLALSAEPDEESWGPNGLIPGLPYGDGRAVTRAIVDSSRINPRQQKRVPAAPEAAIRIGICRAWAS